MQKRYCVLQILFLLMSSSWLLNGSEIPTRSKLAQPIVRRRSPLASEMPYTVPYKSDADLSDTDENMGPSCDEQEEDQEALPIVVNPLPISNITKLRHNTDDYEVTMQFAPLENCQATAVINPCNFDTAVPRASRAIYNKCGSEFCEWFRDYQEQKRANFIQLMAQPGNTLLLPLGYYNQSGCFATAMMAFMHIPQSVSPKKVEFTLGAICNGLSVTLSQQLYQMFRKYDMRSANVILPAFGSDAVYKGYPGPRMAKLLLYTVVRVLRFLHGTGSYRLNSVSFLIDNQETYGHYAAAFKEFAMNEHDNFTMAEAPSEIASWS